LLTYTEDEKPPLFSYAQQGIKKAHTACAALKGLFPLLEAINGGWFFILSFANHKAAKGKEQYAPFLSL